MAVEYHEVGLLEQAERWGARYGSVSEVIVCLERGDGAIEMVWEYCRLVDVSIATMTWRKRMVLPYIFVDADN